MDNLINLTISIKINNETTSTTRIATLNVKTVKNTDKAITEELNNKVLI